ncbi:type II toxin-antitoxin system VapC family toxin [Aetokthonos hydrillicola Thurmond2011]|uniref:Type II toxin-antitoxin system VapC family toxin n=1 Tax=Aetokthonos hydrillicola Thurmond2011 TaxID=2712845 RepID=A0AAP5MCQ5_9CYAN|nr:type II toxin-antitoxin system VapC family toxin [Aetokthonos hydrillicola]MBO3459519.1 type II toxin-antitoxin system VapC family toxin [Aetokthonos hydrillicola CCALA 1050]MBW4591056.1 type II toxin-antitoxin system VapC family toxin [Aetokthonos hydrillicola CCALA 1050]MDR9899447.1 type II toxin-antitoxin system VapC family toxin [Aetokthonos hydrillicola Thurmond2011]
MTVVWVLDTDHLSLFQREHPTVKQRINQINFTSTAITIVTLEEQMKGWLNVINKYNDQPSQSKKLILAYKGLRDGVEYLNQIKLLDFDQSAYNCYQELVRQRIRIGTRDLRIAAITLSVDGILVTRNTKDFAKVPNLKIEDWTIS